MGVKAKFAVVPVDNIMIALGRAVRRLLRQDCSLVGGTGAEHCSGITTRAQCVRECVTDRCLKALILVDGVASKSVPVSL